MAQRLRRLRCVARVREAASRESVRSRRDRRRRRAIIHHEKERLRAGPSFASSPLPRQADRRGHRRGLDGPSMPRPTLKNCSCFFRHAQVGTTRRGTLRSEVKGEPRRRPAEDTNGEASPAESGPQQRAPRSHRAAGSRQDRHRRQRTPERAIRSNFTEGQGKRRCQPLACPMHRLVVHSVWGQACGKRCVTVARPAKCLAFCWIARGLSTVTNLP
jgi:hypothetical protein